MTSFGRSYLLVCVVLAVAVFSNPACAMELSRASATAPPTGKLTVTIGVEGEEKECKIKYGMLVSKVVRECLYPADRKMAEAQASNLHYGGDQLPANSKIGDPSSLTSGIQGGARLVLRSPSEQDVKKGAANIVKAAIKGKQVRKKLKRLKERHVNDKAHADNEKAQEERKRNMDEFGTEHKPNWIMRGPRRVGKLFKNMHEANLRATGRMPSEEEDGRRRLGRRRPLHRPPGRSQYGQNVLDTEDKLKDEVRQQLGAPSPAPLRPRLPRS